MVTLSRRDCDSMLFRREPKTWKQAPKDMQSNNIYTARFDSAARGLRFRISQRMKAFGKAILLRCHLARKMKSEWVLWCA